MESNCCFVVDVGIGIAVENWLAPKDYKVIPVRTTDPEMKDEAIFLMAVNEKPIIITMDQDFGELVCKEKMPHYGVLLLAIIDTVLEESLAIVQNIFTDQV